MGNGLKWLLLLALIAAGGILIYVFKCPLLNIGCPTPSTTKLTMDLQGGFAYVKVPGASANEVDVSFLKDTMVYATDGTTPICKVHQLGVTLQVMTGTLIQPASQPADGFPVADSTITIGDLGSSPAPLVTSRSQSPPNPSQMANPDDPAQWDDLKWVASVKDHYGSGTALRSDWLTKVSGRLRLTSGTLAGHHPTDVSMQRGVWELSGGTGAPSPFTQAMTNWTVYTVDVQGDQVVLNLSGSPSQIIVRADANHKVKLSLAGVHDDSSNQYQEDQPIDDYCAFYQLLDPVPTPSTGTAWLIPHWKGDPRVTDPKKKGKASPGGACPGDYVP